MLARASEKVGGVASACSAFVTRRELDAIAATNSDDSSERRASSNLSPARLAAAFALLLAGAFPVAAQDVLMLGNGVEGSGPFTMSLDPRAEDNHLADLTIDNRLTSGSDGTDAPMSIDGLTIRVQVTFGAGDVPDRVTVIVPDDCIAIPDMIDVPEDATGVIRIFRLTGMVMG